MDEIDRVNGGMGAEGTEFAQNANGWLQSVIDAGNQIVNGDIMNLLPSYEQAIREDFSTGSRSGTSGSSGSESSTSTSADGYGAYYTSSKQAWQSTSVGSSDFSSSSSL
jgi:hypothetical protein